MASIKLNREELEVIHKQVIEYRVQGLSVRQMSRILNRTEYFIRKYLWYSSPSELKRIVDAEAARLVESSKKHREEHKKLNDKVLKLVREVEEEFGSISNAPTSHKNFAKIRKIVGTK